MCNWHLTSDGPPVVSEGKHGIEIWVAYQVIGGWCYDKDYCTAAGVWTVKKPDRWAYITPPRDDAPADTGALAERYLKVRRWLDWHAISGGTFWTHQGITSVPIPSDDALGAQLSLDAPLILRLLGEAGHIPAEADDDNA